MSITITTDVVCDDPDCRAWIDGTTGSAADSMGARRRARRYGWARTRDGRDLCPEHKP